MNRGASWDTIRSSSGCVWNIKWYSTTLNVRTRFKVICCHTFSVTSPRWIFSTKQAKQNKYRFQIIKNFNANLIWSSYDFKAKCRNTGKGKMTRLKGQYDAIIQPSINDPAEFHHACQMNGYKILHLISILFSWWTFLLCVLKVNNKKLNAKKGESKSACIKPENCKNWERKWTSGEWARNSLRGRLQNRLIFNTEIIFITGLLIFEKPN